MSYNIFMNTKKAPEESKEIVEVDYFSQGLVTIQQKIADEFTMEIVKMLMRVAHEISVIGLSEKEAVLISGYDYKMFTEMKEKHPIVQELIELKDLEYKRELLKNLSSKAMKSDDKVAQWLLEARYPAEYNKRKGGPKGSEEDGQGMIAMALEFVRKTDGGENSLIKEESGRAFLIKTQKGPEIIKDIKKVLS